MWPTAILLSKKRFNLNHTVLQAATFPNSTFLSNLCTSELTNSASNGTQTNCEEGIAANPSFLPSIRNTSPPACPQPLDFAELFKIIIFKGPDSLLVKSLVHFSHREESIPWTHGARRKGIPSPEYIHRTPLMALERQFAAAQAVPWVLCLQESTWRRATWKRMLALLCHTTQKCAVQKSFPSFKVR